MLEKGSIMMFFIAIVYFLPNFNNKVTLCKVNFKPLSVS